MLGASNRWEKEDSYRGEHSTKLLHRMLLLTLHAIHDPPVGNVTVLKSWMLIWVSHIAL